MYKTQSYTCTRVAFNIMSPKKALCFINIYNSQNSILSVEILLADQDGWLLVVFKVMYGILAKVYVLTKDKFTTQFNFFAKD